MGNGRLAECLSEGGGDESERTYTHVMPNSQARARKAVDGVFRGGGDTGDGPQTAQEDEKAS